MVSRKVRAAILGVAVAIAAAACGNPFGSEDDEGRRFSPAVNNLQLSRSNIFCGTAFTITFSYDDPQDDIDVVDLTFTGESNGGLISDTLEWDDERIDLSTPGIAVISYEIDCGDDNPDGTYSLGVRLTDLRRHTSNTETVEFDLL